MTNLPTTTQPQDDVTSIATSDERVFRIPSHVAEDVAFAIEANDSDVILAVAKKHQIVIDTFLSADVPTNDAAVSFDGLPPFRLVSVSIMSSPETPELLISVPAEFSQSRAVELAMRIVATGRAYPNYSALGVELEDGRDMTLIGHFDRSASQDDCYIFGWNSALPVARLVSRALH